MKRGTQRIWNPVMLGGGVYHVRVDRYGDTFCRVFLEESWNKDANRPYSTCRILCRSYIARPEELHDPAVWEARHAA